MFSVFASLRTPQKCSFGQVRDLSFLIGVDCVVVGVSMIKWLMNVFKACTPTLMISPSLNPNEKLGGKCNIQVPFRTPF